MDMEVCTTLGMLSPEQAAQLKTAGLTAYNHNLDTSREYYPKVSSQVVCTSIETALEPLRLRRSSPPENTMSD